MRKSVINITCAVLSALLLCGCGSAGRGAAGADGSGAGQEYVQEVSAPSPAAEGALVRADSGADADAAAAEIEELYMSVLDGSASFFSADTGADMNISEVGALVSSDPAVSANATVPGYAVLDLDGDGAVEAVLQINIGEDNTWGYLILSCQNERVCGYSVWMRAMLDLKENGLFWSSSGAAEGGISQMSFENGALSITPLIYSELTYDEAGQAVVTYYAYGEQISEAEYQSLNAEFDASANVSWIAK